MNPVLPIVIPMLAALLLPMAQRIHTTVGRWFGPAAVVLNILIAIGLWLSVSTHGPLTESVGGFDAPLGILLRADWFAVVFVFAVSAMALLLWPRGESDRVREETLMLLLVAGGCGLALSADLFNLYVFYELVAVASYGLITSRGSGASFAAALRFLILSAAGSALALLGIAMVYSVTGTLNLVQLADVAPGALHGPLGMTAFTLMLLGFGVKAELFPLNTWVPEVYNAASARVSAYLAGVVSKLALIIVLRLVLTAFADSPATNLLLVVGMVTALSGELAALRATELRRILSYSSIGQLGLAAMAFSVPGSMGILAGTAVMLHHLMVKPALFLLAEQWSSLQGSSNSERLIGLGSRSPLSAALFVMLALSLIGIPPLPGFWAKYLLISALLAQASVWHMLAIGLVVVVTVVKTAYLMGIAQRLYKSEPAESARIEWHNELGLKQPFTPAAVLGGLVILSTLLAAPLGGALAQLSEQAMQLSGATQMQSASVVINEGAAP
jgi:formate hydrogenlyase subunit 3/multisubunit Na+/H+ antiporter MnhD subunit